MKPDEFAFVNQQLAGMLKSGIPLEGALHQLCENMRRGTLREELKLLEADLASGTPLIEALGARKLPEFYVHMMKVGVASNNLPAVLTLLADYYQRQNNVWTRLKGLMLYPAIVLFSSFVLSVTLALIYGKFITDTAEGFQQDFYFSRTLPHSTSLLVNAWFPAVLLGLALTGLCLALGFRGARHALRWKVPAFKEANLWRMASSFSLLLENGCTFNQALDLLRSIERGSPAHAELVAWQASHSGGVQRFADMAAGGKVFPPLFVWLVAGSGEDWAKGFRHAAQIYYERAMNKIEMLLYAVLPVSVLALGMLILLQIMPIIRLFRGLMVPLSSSDDF